MMYPVFFPNTCLTDDERHAIEACFGHTTVFSPLDGTVREQPGVKPLVPLSGHDGELAMMLTEYRQFAAMNMQRASSYLKGADRKPFYDDTWASELRGEIMRHAGDVPDSGKEADADHSRILWARFFLQIAHEYDEKKYETDKELEQVNVKEKQLLKNLMGSEDDGDSELPPLSGAENPHTDESQLMYRMEAWATLFLTAWPDTVSGQGLFLTTMNDAVDMINEFSVPLVKVKDVSLDQVDNDDLARTVAFLTSTSSIPDMTEEVTKKRVSDSGCLSFYLAQGVTSEDLFGAFSKIKPLHSGQKTDIRNTVIGLIKV